MKTENLLKKVNEIIELSPKEEQKIIRDVIEHNEKISKPYLQWQAISNLYIELCEEIKNAEAKTSGDGKRLQVAKRILKNGGKYRTALEYSTVKNGKQYFTDGFRLAILKKHLPLAVLPKDEALCFPDTSYFDRMADIENYKIIDTPDISRLQAYIKIEKANKTKDILYCFGEGLATVDANYLLDMLVLFPNAEIRFTGQKSALIFVCPNGDKGLLMPMNRPSTAKTEI